MGLRDPSEAYTPGSQPLNPNMPYSPDGEQAYFCFFVTHLLSLKKKLLHAK